MLAGVAARRHEAQLFPSFFPQAYIEDGELTLGRYLQKRKGGRPRKAHRLVLTRDVVQEALPTLGT